jgi:hypothetical protein
LHLLLCDGLLVTFGELGGPFCDIFGQSQVTFLLLAIGAVDLHFPFRNKAKILCDAAVAAGTFALQKFQHFLGIALPVAFAEGAEVGCVVLANE